MPRTAAPARLAPRLARLAPRLARLARILARPSTLAAIGAAAAAAEAVLALSTGDGGRDAAPLVLEAFLALGQALAEALGE